MGLIDRRCDPAGADGHLHALDSLRGLAIGAVLLHHAYASAYPSGWWLAAYGPWGFWGSWASNGWLGVNLFFILSGFVLYWPVVLGVRGLSSGADWRAFYVRRARRLLPLYYLSVFVLVGLAAPVTDETLARLLTLTFNFHRDSFFPSVNGVLWSLGIEVWFSLVFPFLVVALQRWGWRRVAAGVFLLALACRLVGSLVPGFAYDFNPFLNPVKDSLLGRLDDFLVGMLLAAAWARGVRVRAAVPLALGGVAGCTAAAVGVDLAVTGVLPGWALVFANTLFQAGAAALVLALLSRPGLRLRALELMGLMCYSIYVWHGVLMQHLTPYPHDQGWWRYGLVLAGLSWLSYRYVEFGHVADWRRLLPARATALR